MKNKTVRAYHVVDNNHRTLGVTHTREKARQIKSEMGGKANGVSIRVAEVAIKKTVEIR